MFTKRQSTKFSNAFTLAEVLITLGIIGIISAMTIPMLIQKYSQYVVEIKLKRFYTTMAQAITMAETDYGAKEHWYGELRPGAGENIKWFNTYLKPYLKVTQGNDGIYYFPDGSGFTPSSWLLKSDYVFYTGHVKKCKKLPQNGQGRCAFSFIFMPTSSNIYPHSYGKGFEPFKFGWNGQIEQLKTNNTYGCNSFNSNSRLYFCTALIQTNNWKIPKDYPFRVTY